VLTIPFEPTISGLNINVHLILEYVAFFSAYRYYLRLRKHHGDVISMSNRLSIILGAAIGAFVGSRFIGVLENPVSSKNLMDIYNSKTIMGGLFGGTLGVEMAKKFIDEPRPSGDLFTLPIILGILIGRIGCFLMGTKEFTYGTMTSFFAGINLGDGLQRHPIALYELLFLAILFIGLRKILRQRNLESGSAFKIFMLSYFGFRFFIEFIKPNVFFLLGLSTIQWLCIACFVYYRLTLIKVIRAY
jgi:phosphatidylglycerol---prolipoprotein diacylglyceryl transferase